MRVVLLGFGRVGQDLARALVERADTLSTRGLKIELVAVADSSSAAVDPRGLDPSLLIERKRSTGRVGERGSNTTDLIRDVSSDVVVELTPGNPKDGEPALTQIREALRSSRSVVSANKAPLALHFTELVEEARKRGVLLRYGACVGGGIPMLEMGRACAEAEEIEGFDAVLNATSNFILTRMQDGGKDFTSALAEARRLGYAEADISLDVDGFDAAAKLVILANHVMGTSISLKDVRPIEGIRDLTTESVRAAASKGKALRALARMHGSPEVGPMEVDIKNPLNVLGATNAVVFRCRDSGDRSVAGPSGGGVATSRAVLRDLVSIANAVRTG